MVGGRHRFRGVNFWNSNLTDGNLEGVELLGADFGLADLSRANLKRGVFTAASFRYTNLTNVNLERSNCSAAHFESAKLNSAILSHAKLGGADFTEASLIGANLVGAELIQARFVNTDLSNANITDCSVYGLSAWDVKLNGAIQANLVVSPKDVPLITVDNLEVAHFVYLLLNNEKIRDVINTIGQKAVLVLGRFSPERKGILDAVAEELRRRGFLPIVFDFEKSQERDFTETIMTLAGLSLFVIADITNPKSAPLELQATIPNYMIPFVPIIQEGESPFSMFEDLQRKFSNWVLETVVYDTKDNLLEGLDDAIIKPALLKHVELISRKTEKMKTRHIKEIINRTSK
jgi:hypothetical protein